MPPLAHVTLRGDVARGNPGANQRKELLGLIDAKWCHIINVGLEAK